MRAAIEFVAVNAAFIALNAIAAGVIWALGTALLFLFPQIESRLAWVLVCLAGIAAALFVASLIVRAPARSRVRARG